MSRTDVHRPGWVQERDPYARHWFKDFHSHEEGICDLQHWLDTAIGWWHTRDYYCHRGQSAGSPNLCGCPMCTWHFGRHYRHRQERVAWRLVRQDLLKLGTQDLDDVDVPPLYRTGKGW